MKKQWITLALAYTCMTVTPSWVWANQTQHHQHTLPSHLMNNPLLHKSPLQYQTPEFDKIKDEHFKPAFDFGMSEQLKEIEAITNNPSSPTFENTILALEFSGQDLKRAQIVFYNLTSANSNESLQKLLSEYSPKFAAHADKITLNEKLYERIKKVYDNRYKMGLQGEDLRLVEYYQESFARAGANLNQAQKNSLKQINEELAKLSSEFSIKLLDARKNGAVVVDDINLLEGLSEAEIAVAKEAAEQSLAGGKYLLSLLNTTQQPLLSKLKNRELRQKLFEASWTRAEKGNDDDTRATIEAIVRARMHKAQLLGYKNYAEWSIAQQMAKTPEAAEQLLKKVVSPAVKRSQEEASEIQQLIERENNTFQLQPWDWNFYAEQVRKEKYDMDQSLLAPYFEVNSVLEKGVFFAANKLYGITFKKRTDLPVYHPDVLVYEVFDNDGKSLALYYLDFYARDSKKGGAWMNNFVKQSHYLQQNPVIVNVFNYQKPAAGEPSLISYDDVRTLFHEFGHGLHGLFADQKYPSISGTAVARDFVEFPSQINEKWALEPSVLKNYAVHYQTGEAIPQVLVDKLKKSDTFNMGYATIESVSAALIDMAWHTIESEEQIKPVLEFEKEVLKSYNLDIPQIPPRYHSPYFAHVFGGGYAAGYYSYMWAEVLDASAFNWIEKNGGLTRANGDKFRKDILSVGNSIDLNEAFRNFTGENPQIEPLLRSRGLMDN